MAQKFRDPGPGHGPWPGNYQPARNPAAYDPYRQYAEANAELTRQYTRMYHPERVNWSRPDADEGPGVLSWKAQRSWFPRRVVTDVKQYAVPEEESRLDFISRVIRPGPTGGSDLNRKLIWSLIAGGATYGLVSARARRGWTPLVFAGAAALVIGRAVDAGISIDERVLGRDII